MGDELQIEMTGRFAERARDRMNVNRRDGRIDRQVRDTGLLRRFAQAAETMSGSPASQ